ncbi:MAG: Calx-beta domain-containing protein [Steroidobacteraceae bacterium]
MSLDVTRTDGSDGAISVTLAPAGTATVGADYTVASTIVSFAAGDASTKTVRVIVADDTALEPDETVTLTMGAPTGGVTIGANAAATITIKDNDPPPAPVLKAVTSDVKKLFFSWQGGAGATSFRLLESPEGDAEEFEPVDLKLGAGATSATLDIAVHGLDWQRAQYKVEACAQERCSESIPVGIEDAMVRAIGRFKGVNTSVGDLLGGAVAISRDGRTIAVGAPLEDSAAGGIGRCGADSELGKDSGAVYVFVHDAQGQ